MNPIGLEQKNVIIQRDRYGYGLTVSGDNPVYVLSVREGGAAHRAGININDQIIKVGYFYSNMRKKWKMLNSVKMIEIFVVMF